MSNESYVNHYVEILTGTMQDAVLRNISLQANAKITEEVINDLQKKVEELTESSNSNLENHISRIEELSNNVKQKQDEINDLRNRLVDYDSVKHQVNHVETFRNELSKARQEVETVRSEYEAKIKSLNEQIEYLQLTPAKRKKVDEAKAKTEVTPDVDVKQDESTTRDGGSF